MGINTKSGSIVLALTTLFLLLFAVSSTVSAASVQNSEAGGQYAYSKENSNIASSRIESPYTTTFLINDNIWVRSRVYDGSDINYIIDTYGDGTTLTIDATEFAAFYYDIDENVTTESFSIKDVAGTENNIIGEGGLVYKTNIQTTDYRFEEWGTYPIIGFFTEPYIPLNPDRADKLAKLVLDSDDKYTIRVGELLDLGHGYAIEIKQIDVESDKVWLEFTKDGELVDNAGISVSDHDNTWDVVLDGIQGEDGVVVLKLHINQVFRGEVDEIAQIEGIWLIDYINATTIGSGDEFGALNDVSISGDTLSISNGETFTLTRDSEPEIGQGLYFKIADTSPDVLRFCIMKEITEPETTKVRGQVATGDFNWTATNFAGFYYDFDDNIATESLEVSELNGENRIPEGGLVYETSIEFVSHEYKNITAGWDVYPVIGFFGEQYVPLNPAGADKLAKLVLDSDDEYNIKIGELLDLGEGYAIEAKEVDFDGNKVRLEFTKDGEFVDDEILSVDTGNNTWELVLNGIQGEDNVFVLKVHVNQLLQDEADDVAQIEGIWLIDYINATTIESDDEFGALNDVSISGDTLSITNDEIFTLTRDSDQKIAQGLYFRVADTPSYELRYYPFVGKNIEENNPVPNFTSINENFEIRSPVLEGSDIDDIIYTYGDGTTLTIDATEFATFYYDIDENVTTESLSIVDVAGTEDNVIGAGGIVYQTTIQQINYKYENITAGWDMYPVIGFFGEQYVPLNPAGADKLAKLVLDSDDEYNIKIGELLDLGEGYAIEAKEIDVDGEKVWLEFTKDGEFVDDETLSVDSGNNTWELELDGVQGENNVVVLRVHVNQLLQDEADDIAQIEGIWLIDYINATTIESEDEFGALNDVSINGDTLSITNDNAFTLTRDSEPEIGHGLYFKVADTSFDVLRFYIGKENTEPGTYKIRGQVVSGTGGFTWNAINFAGFYYDLDNNIATESLSVSGIDGNVIPEGGLVYETGIEFVDYEYSNPDAGWDMYPVTGFFGEKCVPLNPGRADKLAKLILDSDDRYSIRTGELLDLGQGYAVEVKQIDINGTKVWLEFTKDGEYVDDEIISIIGDDNTWDVELDEIQEVYDVIVLKLNVKHVFQGTVDNIAQIEGIWLIDYVNATTIDSDEGLGALNDVSINGNILIIRNKDNFTLNGGSEEKIGPGTFFKIADTPVDELRYYPFIEKVIVENSSKVPPTANFSTNVSSGYAPLAVRFTDLSEDATSRSWDVNNDGVEDSNEENFVYVYNTTGTYTANLTISNPNGTDSKTAVITVLEPEEEEIDVLPVADFTVNKTSGYYPLTVLFTDTSQYTTGRSWDVNGDGVEDSNEESFAYTYTSVGTYEAKMTAINANGTDIKTTIIKVENESSGGSGGGGEKPDNSSKVLPTANFSTNVSSGYAPLAVQFTDLSEDATSRSWDFGDGINSSEQNPIHSYSIVGSYTVNLTVYNPNGTDSKTAVITVLEEEGEGDDETNTLPIANFTVDKTGGYYPLTVLFTDTSQYATGRSWDVNGDGVEDSNETSFSYTYTSSGTYEAKLTAINANGTDIKTTTITVEKKSSGGSSSGGGGGGSPEPAKNVEVKELSQVFITNGKAVKFDFKKSVTCVMYVSFDAKKTAGKTTTIVEQLKNKSTLASGLPSGEVYKFFNIWVGNSGFATSKNIENPVIGFKVEKAWVWDNNIDWTSISLNRYSENKWEQFSASLEGEDNKYLYFTAETPGFSPFAITGKGIASQEETITGIRPADETDNSEENTGDTGSKAEEETEQETSTGMPGFEMLYGVTGLLAVFHYIRK